MSRTPSVDRERDLAARDLRDACEATDCTASEVARTWGASETLAREVLHGARPLTAEREALLPRRVRDEYRRRRAAGDAPRSHPLSPEGQAHVVLAGAGATVSELARALVDGRLSPDEARAALPELRRLLAAGRELEGQLEERARPGLRAVGT